MSEMLTIPTFIIGLGGIGQKITAIIADRFHNSMGFIPPTIRIRAIDSAPQEEFNIPIPKDRFFTQIGGFDAYHTIQNLSLFPQIKRWWKYDLNPGFISIGAGSKRPVGRLIFFHDFERINQILSDDFAIPLEDGLQQELMKAGLDQVKRHPRVFLVGSLAGGTCSGMLIDLAFLVRHLLKTQGYESGAINISAVLGLQSVLDVATKDPGTHDEKVRKLNVYGALKEIDYLMGGWPTDFFLEYPAPVGSFPPDQPLFNQTYLFTKTKLSGYHYTDQMEILIRVAHFIFGQVASKTGEVSQFIMDNYKSFFNPDDRNLADGLKGIYGAFGVEWLEVPRQYLVNRWCRELAEKIGQMVTEFEWEKEPKVNINQKYRELLSDEFRGYGKALDFLAAGPEQVFQFREFSDVSNYLDSIQSVKKAKELEKALQQFTIDLPKIMGRVRAAVNIIPPSGQIDNWLTEVVQKLVMDRKFRMGGARRVLEEAAAQFRKLTANPEGQPESIEEIIKQCKSWGGLNPNLALEWAKRKLYQAVCQEIRQVTGERAGKLASRCEEKAASVERLQEHVRRAAQTLTQVPFQQVVTSRDTWLLNPEDMDAVIQSRPEEVAREVADQVVKSLAENITAYLSPHLSTSNFEPAFQHWVEAAVDKAVARFTKRPADVVDRLKRRMNACEPLARIITSGPEFLKIMAPGLKSTPLKIVLTGLGPDERKELDSWANEENLKASGSKPFQVFSLEDASRDDVAHITFGWPLWLFNEIRDYDDPFEKAKNDEYSLYQTAFNMNEFEGCELHSLKPLPLEDLEQWFGIALALGHITFKIQAIEFLPKFFGAGGKVEAPSVEILIERAFEFFQKRARNYAKVLLSDANRDQAAFRKNLLDGVEKREELLAKSEVELPSVLTQKLYRYYSLARQFAEGIVIL